MKRLISALVALAMVLSMFPAVFATETQSGSGTMGDPYVLSETGDYSVAVTETKNLYFSFTAAESGKLTFTVNSTNWNFFVMENTTSGIMSEYMYQDDGFSTHTVEVYEGDELIIRIYSNTDAPTLDFTLGFEQCEVDKTVSVYANWSFEGAEVTVDAGSRVNCQVTLSNSDATLYIKGENFYVVIGEESYYPDESGKLVLPLEHGYDAQTVYLYNTGDETATYIFGVDYALGSQNNPEDLTDTDLGDFKCVMPQSGYHYSWTASESGKLTITMLDEENWVYTIENLNTGDYYTYPSMNWVTYEEERIPTVTIEVNEGDVVNIKLEREDWTAGELNFNLAFVAGAVEKSVDLSADTYELPAESVEVAPGASIRYDITSYLDGGKLTITGENFYVVVGGTGVYNAETGVFLPEGGTRYDPVEGVVSLSLPDYQESTVHIVNTGDTAATYVFGFDYPVGTMPNPELFVDSDSIELEENSNPYYFAYEATGNGYINVGILAEMGLFYNIYTVPSDPDVEGSYSSETTVEDASEGIVFSIPVHEGDLVYIAVNNWDVDDSIPAGKIEVSVSFVEVEHAGRIECDWDGNVTVDDDNVFEIPANGSALYELMGFSEGNAVLTGENFYVIVNGEKLYPVDGAVIIPFGNIMVHIFNTSDEAISLTATIEFPLGSYENPDELTMGDHSVQVPMYGFYFFNYVAPADGILIFDMTCSDWEIMEWNSYVGFSSGEGDTDAIFEIYEGDVLVFRLNTVMGNAGTISFTASFEEGSFGGGDGEHEYLGDGEELIDGDNYVEVEEDSEYGSEWYYVPTMTGNLQLTITDLMCFVDGEWSALDLIALGNGLRMGSVTLWANDTQIFYDMDNDIATATIPVVAGNPVIITMASANGTGLRATLNLAVASNVHDANDGILMDGTNEFDVAVGNTELTYTATVDGKLTIEMLGGSIYDDWFEEYTALHPSELSAVFVYGMLTLTVNGEPVSFEDAMVNEDHPIYYNILLQLDVNAGDEVVLVIGNEMYAGLSMTLGVSVEEGEAGPNIIDELPAELVADFATEDDAYLGMQWLHTVQKDGTLELLAVPEGVQIQIMINGEVAYIYDDGYSMGVLDVAAGDELQIDVFAHEAGTYSFMLVYGAEATVTVDTVTAAPGETVTLKVFITVVKYASYQLTVNYDGSLTLVGIDAGEESLGAFTGNPETGIVLDYTTVNTDVEGVIITLTFEVAKDAEAGLHEVGLELHGFFDANGEEILVDVVSGGINVHNHTYKADVTKPTCTEGGYTTYTCTVCGDSYIADKTEPLGHSYEASVTKPTCTEGGYTTYTCTVCGDSYIADKTEPLGHSYEASVTKPTCTEGGYTTYTCTVCGDSYIADKTEPLGHTEAAPVEENRHYENGACYVDYVVYCSVCKEELSRETVKLYTLGNVNGDDEIDVRDAMVVAQYIVGDITGEQLDVAAADVNGDEEIDVRDAMLIAQLIVGDITVFPAEANQ